ncbi:MAG: carboxypeptidase regulatory-like domain-containing protein [Gemmatimonadales bacterium]|nr:MAG: carboxypeptidase regulatory-like domain-containing protein [Gemmatimonadales bacterium]
MDTIVRTTSVTARWLAVAGVVCVLALPPALTAQQQAWETFDGPRVEGRVIEAVSGEPLSAAAVRVVSEDGQQVFGSGYTDDRGLYRLIILADADDLGVPVVVEAGRLGYRVSISEPFELDPDGVVTVPDLEVQPEPVMLDTLEVRRRAHWSYIAPPRERVLERQLQGQGTFLAGASINAARDRTITESIANRIEGVEFRGGARAGSGRLQSLLGRRCLVVLVNEWPAGHGAINRLRREHIGAVEVYREWNEVPEELRHHILNQPGSSAPPLCGLVNIWLWDSWNRGIQVPDG